MRCALEVRSASGKLVENALPPAPLVSTFRHATLDVAAAVVGGPDDALPAGFSCTRLVEGEAGDCAGMDVSIVGHEVDSGDEGGGSVRPFAVGGHVSLVDGESRGFVDTGEVDTVMGMCGGPVVGCGEGGGAVVGMLEGLVPRLGGADGGEATSEQHRKVAGQSVFVTANELRLFVADVEKEWLRAQAGEKREHACR